MASVIRGRKRRKYAECGQAPRIRSGDDMVGQIPGIDSPEIIVVDNSSPSKTARYLSYPVGYDFSPGEITLEGKCQGDCRIDVRSGDPACHINAMATAKAHPQTMTIQPPAP